MTRRDQKLARALKLLNQARAAIIEAIDQNEAMRAAPRDQIGSMELAYAADSVTKAIREIGYAKKRNGYGQPRQ